MTTADPGAARLPTRSEVKELRLRALAETDPVERRRLLDELSVARARRRLDQSARQLLRSGDPKAVALALDLAKDFNLPPRAPDTTEVPSAPVRPSQPRRPRPAAPRPERPPVPDFDPTDTRPAAVILTDVYDAPPGFVATLAALDDVTLEEKVLRIADRHPAMADLIRRALAEHQVAAELDSLDDA